MNVKVTDLNVTKNNTKHNIPNIIHFLPGCNDHQESWKEFNPEFMIISWDNESIQKVLKQSILHETHIDLVKDDFIISCILCYVYGGVVITKPEKCFLSIQHILGNIPTTLLALFSLSESTLLDTSILIASAKISAFTSLMEYFLLAKKQSKSTAVVFRDFIMASMEASNDGAILCLHSDVKNKLTKAPPETKHNKKLIELETMLPSSNLYKILNPSLLASEIKPWLTHLGKIEASLNTTDEIGILVIDSNTFNQAAPVPDAIAAVVAFQEVMLCDDAIVIVAHSPLGGISLDMMLIPQLTIMNAKEIYRTDHVAWKLARS